MRINRNILATLFIENYIFQKIDEEFKEELLFAIDSHTYNLALVSETRIGIVFLRYLAKVKKVNIGDYSKDLLLYLQLIAALNKRKEIIDSDLHMLHKIYFADIENWQKILRNTIGKTVFREYYLYLDQNAVFKDQLTISFYNHTISNNEIELAQEIIKWLEESIVKLEQSEHHPVGVAKMTNRFYQQEIYIYYHEQLQRILQIMNFQLRAFKLIETY